MTVLRLGSGAVVVHSPVAPTGEVRQAVEALGPVSAIVAPSRMHDLDLAAWQKAHPAAALLAAPGMDRDHRELRVDSVLPAVPAAWREEIDGALLEGAPRLNEVVWLHRPSRSLVVADLVFDLEPQPTLASRLMARMLGTATGPATSRLFRSAVKDRGAFAASLQRVLAWDFEGIVVGHGRVVEGGPDLLRRICSWALSRRA